MKNFIEKAVAELEHKYYGANNPKVKDMLADFEQKLEQLAKQKDEEFEEMIKEVDNYSEEYILKKKDVEPFYRGFDAALAELRNKLQGGKSPEKQIIEKMEKGLAEVDATIKRVDKKYPELLRKGQENELDR